MSHTSQRFPGFFAVGALCVLAVSGCVTTPPETDPVLIKLTDLENRLVKMERLLENQGLLELHGDIQQLQAETMEVRGIVEKLQFDASGAAQRQRDQYLDLDKRLASLEQGVSSGYGSGGAVAGGAMIGSEATTGRTTTATSTVATIGDQGAYQVAFGLLKEGRYDEAAVSFTDFLATYPESNLRDNAQYWLAESRYVVRKYREALPLFQVIIDDFPQSRKTADTLLKIGFCHYELKQFGPARTALRTVVDNHGDSTAARLAQQRLEKMRQDGV